MLCKLEQKALLTIKYKKYKTQTNLYCKLNKHSMEQIVIVSIAKKVCTYAFFSRPGFNSSVVVYNIKIRLEQHYPIYFELQSQHVSIVLSMLKLRIATYQNHGFFVTLMQREVFLCKLKKSRRFQEKWMNNYLIYTVLENIQDFSSNFHKTDIFCFFLIC